MKRAAGLFLAVPVLLLLAACQAEQSVMAPHGPVASEIAALAWLLFALAALILLIVGISLWIALRGSVHLRAILADTRAVHIGGIVFPIVTLTALLIYGFSLTRTTGQASGGDPSLRVDVVGEQWWWRTTYVTADGARISGANEIRMPVGQEVEFVLTSADVIHSFWVASLGGKVDMIPGRVNRLRLTAERPGIYRGQCAEYCGGAHAWMGIKVVALEPRDFADWLRNQAAPGVPPDNEDTRRGQAIFLSAGCGACHEVRGTDAKGTIGPDLTHLGARHSVGVDTLPLTRENIRRFIVDGQHVKPGNLMPPFRIFTEEELNALSAYLAALR